MGLRDGHGRSAEMAFDAGQIAVMIRRLQELENLVRGWNEAKKIVVGVDQQSVPRSKWGKAGEC
jgi:LPS sulfotransferase NodH